VLPLHRKIGRPRWLRPMVCRRFQDAKCGLYGVYGRRRAGQTRRAEDVRCAALAERSTPVDATARTGFIGPADTGWAVAAWPPGAGRAAFALPLGDCSAQGGCQAHHQTAAPPPPPPPTEISCRAGSRGCYAGGNIPVGARRPRMPTALPSSPRRAHAASIHALVHCLTEPVVGCASRRRASGQPALRKRTSCDA